LRTSAPQLTDEFKLKCKSYTAELNFSNESFSKANDLVNAFFNQLHTTVTRGMQESDKIFVVFFHTSLDIPKSIQFMYRDDLSADVLSSTFISVCQSKKICVSIAV